MGRELLIKGTSAAAAAAAAYALRGPARALLPDAARATTTPAWNHDPRSPIGPLHWADIDPGFSACGSGLRQSPVNIETAHVGVLHGPPLLRRYQPSELAVENTGHVVEVMIPPGVEDVLQIGEDGYQLTQYHFHAPSEHTVNGRHADVEGHFVHTNAGVTRPSSSPCSTASAPGRTDRSTRSSFAPRRPEARRENPSAKPTRQICSAASAERA